MKGTSFLALVVTVVTACTSITRVRAPVAETTATAAPSCARACQALPEDRQFACLARCPGAVVFDDLRCGAPEPRNVCVERHESHAAGLVFASVLAIAVGVVILASIDLPGPY